MEARSADLVMAPETSRAISRLSEFDRLRGLIMVLMAIDHASFFIARVHASETWFAPGEYASVTAFVTPGHSAPIRS